MLVGNGKRRESGGRRWRETQTLCWGRDTSLQIEASAQVARETEATCLHGPEEFPIWEAVSQRLRPSSLCGRAAGAGGQRPPHPGLQLEEHFGHTPLPRRSPALTTSPWPLVLTGPAGLRASSVHPSPAHGSGWTFAELRPRVGLRAPGPEPALVQPSLSLSDSSVLIRLCGGIPGLLYHFRGF